MNTKHDLSFDKTKLDFDALMRTASIAYSNSRCEVERLLSELQNTFPEGYKSAKFPLDGERLAKAAEQLAVAASTYHTLVNAMDRNEIEIINKPVVTGGK